MKILQCTTNSSTDNLCSHSKPIGKYEKTTLLKSRIHECAEWFANYSQTVLEPNAHMCGWDCKPALSHLRMVRVSFATNQNLLFFCANTKRTGWSGCLFRAPGVLCSPQVHRKLINHAPHTNCARVRAHSCI